MYCIEDQTSTQIITMDFYKSVINFRSFTPLTLTHNKIVETKKKLNNLEEKKKFKKIIIDLEVGYYRNVVLRTETGFAQIQFWFL